MPMPSVKTFEELEKGNIAPRETQGGSLTDDVQRKTVEALDFIQSCLSISNSSVCLCSFGKDSLVMLHLIRQLYKVPVIYWREPFFQTKYNHPQKVAELWDLDVYDYPPSATDYIQLEDYFDVYNFYYVNGVQYINLYTGTRQYKKGEKFLCAIKDLLMRPRVSSYDFNWDCVFHGHKQCDPLYISEGVKLPRVKLFGKGIMSLPVRDWTDGEIWEYIRINSLPYNKERYDNSDESKNNDLFPTCHDCLDYRKDKVVCPKTGKKILCVGKSKEDNLAYRDNLLKTLYK